MAAHPGYYHYRFNSDLARVLSPLRTCERTASWTKTLLVALRHRVCSTPHLAHNYRDGLRPGYSIHLTRPPTLREVLLALCEAARRPATEDPLDMLKEFDLDGLSYELNERDKAPVWINKKDHAPIITRLAWPG